MADNIPIDTMDSRVGSIREVDRSSKHEVDVEQPNILAEKEADLPPDGGYGWVCVACCAMINAHTWGINSSYAVFLAYYLSNNIFPNTSALDYAFIGGLSISQAVLMAPIGTRVTHYYGTKVCLHIGVFFETLSLIGASFATQKWQIILAQGLCFGWGIGFLFVGSVGILAQWFLKRRSLANSISAAGSGIGGVAYSLATQRAIDTLGLPWAFRILGLCTFAVNLTAANLLRDRNRQTGSRHRAFDLAMLKRPEFLFLQGWSWCSMFGYTVILFTIPAYAKSIGLTSQQGSILAAVLNVGQAIGRPFIGLSSDRWGRLNLATIYSLLCGILCLALWIPAEFVADPMPLLCVLCLFGGAVAGTFWCTIAPVAAEVVGLQDLPGALSWTWIIMTPPTTFAEPIALEIRKPGAQHWMYLGPELFTAVMYIAGSICLWIVRGWKVGQLEELERRRADEAARQRAILSDEKGIEIGNLQAVRSASISRASWDSRDLFRRMTTWRNV